MIRQAAPPADAAACAAIYAPHVTEGVASFEIEPPDAAEMARRMQAAHLWLVAAGEGGEVTGYAYASPHRDRPAYRWTAETSVYVAADRQGRGVGRALYEALFAGLAERGFRTLLAGITLPNAASVALHERVGFEQVGLFRAVGFKAGEWWDVGWWQRTLP